MPNLLPLGPNIAGHNSVVFMIESQICADATRNARWARCWPPPAGKTGSTRAAAQAGWDGEQAAEPPGRHLDSTARTIVPGAVKQSGNIGWDCSSTLLSTGSIATCI